MTTQHLSPLELAEIRAALPVTSRVVFLNTGTAGPAAAPVIAALIDATTRLEQEGYLAWGALNEQVEQARTRFAALLGVQPDELAFTRNATEGVNLVASGIDWTEGDEVLTTAEEHPAVGLPLANLSERYGVRVRRLPFHDDPAPATAAVEAALTPRTRLLVMSYVSSETGRRLPAREVCAVAARHGVLSMIDGAQALGVFPINLRQIGCDFFTSNAHKWLCGPKGTGFFVVRSDRLATLRLGHMGAGHLTDDGRLQYAATARRFEYGTRGLATHAASAAALDWLERWGWPAIEGRMGELSAYLRAGLADLPGVTLHTPAAWDRTSALTSFSLAGWRAEAIKARLWERHRIYSRLVSSYNAVRLSTAYFNTKEDLDCALGALRELGHG